MRKVSQEQIDGMLEALEGLAERETTSPERLSVWVFGSRNKQVRAFVRGLLGVALSSEQPSCVVYLPERISLATRYAESVQEHERLIFIVGEKRGRVDVAALAFDLRDFLEPFPASPGAN